MSRSSLRFALPAVVVLAACGEVIAPASSTGGTTSGAGGEAGASSGGAGGGEDAGPAIDCTGAFSFAVFPTFDKSCQVDADCALKLHLVNCCGTQIAIGIRASESAAFDAAEAKCESMVKTCGCNSGPTTTEDGKETDYFATTAMVGCDAGMCMSFMP